MRADPPPPREGKVTRSWCDFPIRISNNQFQMRIRILAARCARVLLSTFRPLQSEGAGNAGRRCARSRACSVVNTRVSHHGHTGITRHSPRNGFNGFLRALPGDRAFLSPSSGGVASARLDAGVEASGPHDFTVRKVALSSAAPSASTASRSNVRDDRETPLVWDGMAGDIDLIWVEREGKYFCKWDWTDDHHPAALICPSGKSVGRPEQPTGRANARPMTGFAQSGLRGYRGYDKSSRDEQRNGNDCAPQPFTPIPKIEAVGKYRQASEQEGDMDED
jgi:hypothetical protein